jgi:hypothetical protein
MISYAKMGAEMGWGSMGELEKREPLSIKEKREKEGKKKWMGIRICLIVYSIRIKSILPVSCGSSTS